MGVGANGAASGRRERLRDVLAPLPVDLAERLSLALGLALPEPPPPETQRAFVDDRIRMAAERADIRASELRAALSSLVPDRVAHGVSLDTVATALVRGPPRRIEQFLAGLRQRFVSRNCSEPCRPPAMDPIEKIA